jgi:hypothetical protein
MKDTTEIIILVGIVVVLLVILYYYWNRNASKITESFNVVDTLFDIKTVSTYNTIWTNYIKNANGQSEASIGIWAPQIRDELSYRGVGHLAFNSYSYDTSNDIPTVITIKNASDAPIPTSMTKIFEFGTIASADTAFPFYIYNSRDYTNFKSASNVNYKTANALQYSYTNYVWNKTLIYEMLTNINDVNSPAITKFTDTPIIANYYYNNDTTKEIIYKLDYSNTSINQLSSEISQIQATINTIATIIDPITINKYQNLFISVEMRSPKYFRQFSYPAIATNISKVSDIPKSVKIPQLPEQLSYMFDIWLFIPLGVYLECYASPNYVGLLGIFGEDVGTTTAQAQSSGKYNAFVGGASVVGDYLVLGGFMGNNVAINSIKYSIMPNTLVLSRTADVGLSIYNPINAYLADLNLHLANFNTFNSQILNKTVGYPAFSCWAPQAPENFVSVGHVIYSGIGATTMDEPIINLQSSISCIPKHCYRYARDWVASDIIFSYSANDQYFAIYRNPYTNTFLGTTSRSGPGSFVGKIIPCPKKDYTIDNLISFDGKIRNNCKNYKNVVNKTPIASDDYNNDETNYLQDSIYRKEQKIQELKKYASELQISTDKGTIINQEYNRRQLSTYLEKQRNRIDSALTQLEAGRNKIDFNIKYPPQIINTIVDYITNSPDLPIEQKVAVIATLKQIQTADLSTADARKSVITALKTCPQFDLSGYIKKDPPCFGCNVST